MKYLVTRYCIGFVEVYRFNHFVIWILRLINSMIELIDLICSWTHRGSTRGFLELLLSVSHEPFSLFHHGVLI